MSNNADSHSGRIEGLDGLRAFAVLSVLVFHFWPSLAPGGFLGVDVFFVISGYLITTLLVRERNKAGRIDLLAFWKRRARRLLPALGLVVFTSIAAAWMVSGELLVNIKRQTLGALTFSTNWIEIVAGTDYFNDSARSLFVTFWSLAVEEQFYLLWPILMVGLLLIPSSALRSVIALVAAAVSSLLMAVVFDPQVPTRVYYGTDTHSFGLMIGAALAFAFAGAPKMLASRPWQMVRVPLGFLSIAGLIAMVIMVDSSTAFPYHGGILLASILSAGAVAALPGETTFFTKVCMVRPLAWVGERSYGMYLWHWPVLMIVGTAITSAPSGMGPGWPIILTVIVITFALTEASYRWIEMPIRKVGFRATWAKVRAAFGGPATRLPLPVTATICAVIIFAFACFGIATAPDKSQEQLSIEAGERLIAEQTAASSNATAAPHATGDEPQKDAPKSNFGPAWPAELPIPPGDQIVGLGDSVMSGAAEAIYDRFPGILLNARPILQWHDAPAIVQTMIDKGTMRKVVVMNFGTNAGFKEPDSEAALRSILNMLGPGHRVVLINTVGVSYWVPSTNATLLAISSDYPNTIVADWYSVIQSKPGLLHRDKTHPNDAGAIVYADTIAKALEKLGPGQ